AEYNLGLINVMRKNKCKHMTAACRRIALTVHQLHSAILIRSLLTLFNLESNQICAGAGRPVKYVSFSSPKTSLPDVHCGICLT
ncbi:hypothetical protein NQZ68_000879, partial [Dissostichus eleginoides]